MKRQRQHWVVKVLADSHISERSKARKHPECYPKRAYEMYEIIEVEITMFK